MVVLSIVLLVLFVIVAALLILIVLIQNEEGDSLGGIFAGGSGSAFGSRSGNVLTRATTFLGALFLIISFGLALLSRSPGGTLTAPSQAPQGQDTEWWKEDGAGAAIPAPGAEVSE